MDSNRRTSNMAPPPLPDRSRRQPPKRPSSALADLSSLRVACNAASPQPPGVDYSPLPWSHCFDEQRDLELPSRNGTWRIYTAGMSTEPELAVVFLHGGGHSALSWSLVVNQLKQRVPVLAFDARGHGNTCTTNDVDLSAETQVSDVAEVVSCFFGAYKPKVVLCGHSMGGAMAVRVASKRVIENLVGLVVVDVVEGTALSALPHMLSWIRNRPSSFPSIARAIRYVLKAGHVKNSDSARISIPPQLVYDENLQRWVWRTMLEDTQQYWHGWFEGLSSMFLNVPAAKLLILASVDRLDRDLMIGQMQGKFQNILVPAAGHTVHEDQPDQMASVLLEYLERNRFLSRTASHGPPIYQQRKPFPPRS